MNGKISAEPDLSRNNTGFFSRFFNSSQQQTPIYDDREETKSETEISDHQGDTEDVPILEDLGIDVEEIKANFKSVILF